jgi:hypothetical protein
MFMKGGTGAGLSKIVIVLVRLGRVLLVLLNTLVGRDWFLKCLPMGWAGVTS